MLCVALVLRKAPLRRRRWAQGCRGSLGTLANGGGKNKGNSKTAPCPLEAMMTWAPLGRPRSLTSAEGFEARWCEKKRRSQANPPGKNNQLPHFLAFDFMFIKGNLVFIFTANVYDFEPGTRLPCVPLVPLCPVSRVASLAIV